MTRMIKFKIRNIIFAVLAVLWMAIIFYCSAKPAVESAQMSGAVDRILCEIFISGYDDLTPAEKEEAALRLDHFVRKCAHATEYMILGFLITGAVYTNKSHIKLQILVCFFGVMLYAISDEIHQLFVEGRAGRVTDVLIDSGGGMVGCILFALFYGITLKKINAKKTKNNII